MSGTECLSLSCTGCNLSCRWCQNSDISQVAPEQSDRYQVSPEEMVDLCLQRGLPSIAYTYTEPFTWWEYMYDIAVLAREKGLNDSPEQVAALCLWMAESGLQDVPLHLSRFFPRHKMTDREPTPKKVLLTAREVAHSMGIRSVYLGNI